MPKKESDAYEHTSETAGVPDPASPSTEHHDTARPGKPEANELRPEERREQDGYGPRTHESTRTTRKDDA